MCATVHLYCTCDVPLLLPFEIGQMAYEYAREYFPRYLSSIFSIIGTNSSCSLWCNLALYENFWELVRTEDY